ncbi:MAG: hypothetical protein AAB363_05520 [Planctomycetota bacterium]
MDRSRPARLTPPEDSPVDRTHPARRHTVRIVQRRTPSRAAMLSLVMAISAAAVAFAAWRWWRPAPTVPVYQRTINDVELSWKCEAGHSFTASGQVADRPCAMCDQPAYAMTPYECPQHGRTEVAVRFTSGADGAPRVSQFRVNQGTWFPATDPVRCPHCDVPMLRKLTDPLDAISRGKKKGG